MIARFMSFYKPGVTVCGLGQRGGSWAERCEGEAGPRGGFLGRAGGWDGAEGKEEEVGPGRAGVRKKEGWAV